jgi:ankyrin repeat protein
MCNYNYLPYFFVFMYSGDEQAADVAKILLGVHESDEDSSLVSIDRPQVINLQDSQHFTALHYAARGRQPELVSALLRWGADFGIKDATGNNPLHLVAEGSIVLLLKTLF